MRRPGQFSVLMDAAPAAGGGDGIPPAVVKDPEKDRLAAELEAARNKNTELTRKLAAQPQPGVTRVNTGSESRPDPKELQRQFFERPLESTDAIATARINDVMAANDMLTFSTMEQLAKTQARDMKLNGVSRPELWDQYESEIVQMVESGTQQTPQFRKNSFVWQNAYKNVVGGHALAGDLPGASSKEDGNRSPAVISRTSGGDGPALPSTTPMPASSSDAKLTPSEREMAHKMAPHVGWAHDDAEKRYAHGKWVHENQGTGKGSSQSSWDSVVTTNNRFGKRNVQVADKKAA